MEDETGIQLPDLIITLAYFSIPMQILAALYQYPHLAKMPMKLVILLILFALFILCCGAGHFLRCLQMHGSPVFAVVNILTAIVSMSTALYLLPLIPNLMYDIDQSLREAVKLTQETIESKANLQTFMAFLCHEIRNPLFAVTSSAQFLQDTDLSEEQAMSVGSIFDSSLLMLRLVNDVLDISKIDAGKLLLEERLYDLHALTDKLEANMRTQVHQQHGMNVQLHFRVGAGVPRVVYGDSTRLLQIIYNLISNANKFTSKGCIDLEIEIAKEVLPMVSLNDNHTGESDGFAESNGLLDNDPENAVVDPSHFITQVIKIIIKDTGNGIPPERINYIFEPYSQAKLSDYRTHGGTGLGLAIISSILKLMGGSIDVQSRVGKGSTFTLLMPLKVPIDQTRSVNDGLPHGASDGVFATTKRLPNITESASTQTHHSTLFELSDIDCSPLQNKLSFDVGERHVRGSDYHSTGPYVHVPGDEDISGTDCSDDERVVLVVDDNSVNRKILARMLTHYKIKNHLAENGLVAVDFLRKCRNVTSNPRDPCVGLVLMDLQMPVMDGYEAISSLRELNVSAPIIALTANALSREKDRAMEAGATHFVTKPILRQDLLSLCTKYMP